MSEDKKGWEFADGLECLSYHQKNSSWTGKLLSNTVFWFISSNENIRFSNKKFEILASKVQNPIVKSF